MNTFAPHRHFFLFSIPRLLIILAVIVSVAVFCGGVAEPAQTYIKDGKVYGTVEGAFRHRWWNYYERGLSFAEGEFFKEAVADLSEAIRQRNKDQRMARTYGMHFIDYFPHRELGIVHYQMRNLDEAGKELEVSIDQFPTSKARFYLDRVRKDLIESLNMRKEPPKLTLNLEEDEFWTRDDPVVISGVAEDNLYISNISVHKFPIFLEGSQKKFHFEKNLDLFQGTHSIEVFVKNLPGLSTQREIIIHVDREGPLITVEDFDFVQEGPDTFVSISGYLYDDAGVVKLQINDQVLSFNHVMETSFSEKFKVGEGDIQLLAYDNLGNETSATLPASQSGSLSSRSKNPCKSYLSSTSNSEPRTPHPVPGTFPTAPRALRLAPCALLAGLDSDIFPSIMLAAFSPKDQNPPHIKLKGWTDTQTVFLEKIYLQGAVSDESKIVSLSVNEIPIIRRQGKSIFFGYLSDLEEGENEFIISARDEAGNAATQKISVKREVPQALQLDQRLSLTVLPFEQKGMVSDASLSFQDNLLDALVDQNRFNMIERDRLDVVLQEQQLSRTKLIDKKTALKLGRLVAAQSVLTGSIIETRNGIEIIGRVIDTETSEILATEDVYDEAKDLQALKVLSEGMAIKFHREFPLVVGLVVQQKGKAIFTDLGKDKVKLQRRLIVYREEPIKHPTTGKVLGADNIIIGRAFVTQVMPDLSKAKLIDGKTGTIKPMDKVITE
ncbi:CsgG/HfaB family protein [Thermodesulfobacteriota bacterium]